VALLLGGYIFGGGEDPAPSASRPSSIPTATPQANPPEPILLGQSTGGGGANPGTGGGAGASTYVVKSGDTLFGIAAQLNVPGAQQASWAAEVLRLNGLADASLLRAGQELRLPATTPSSVSVNTPIAPAATATPPRTTTPATTTIVPAASATPRPAVTGGAGTYTVVADDFPILIAQKVGVPEAQRAAWADQLLALNNVTASSLSVGQVLQLPPIGATGPIASTATRVP
jgi:LysM repeat protein